MKVTKDVLKGLIREMMENTELVQESSINRIISTVNEQMKPFFVVSANRSERGSRWSQANADASADLLSFLRSKGLSTTEVEGGYTEFEKEKDPETGKPLKDEEGKDVYKLDKDGKKIANTVKEISYFVSGDQPHFGKEENRIKDTLELFEIAKQACLVDASNPQESFSFGYPIHDEVTGETGMFIALYTPDAPKPGRKHAFTEWGGPWTRIEDFMKDQEGAYTGYKGARGTFVEEQLEEAKNREVKTVNEGRKKQADIDRLTKRLNRIRGVK